MAQKNRSKIIDQSTTTGTGALTLVGTPVVVDGVTYGTFADFLSTNDTTWAHASMGDVWEEGPATYSGGALTFDGADPSYASSTGSKISWAAGTKRITCAALPNATGWERVAIVNPITGTPAALNFTGLAMASRVRISGVCAPGTDGVLPFLQVSTNNGSSYDSSTSNHRWKVMRTDGTTLDTSSSAAHAGMMLGAITVGNATNEIIAFETVLFNFNKAARCWGFTTSHCLNASGTDYIGTMLNTHLGTTARNALRLIMSSGNLANLGTVTVDIVRG